MPVDASVAAIFWPISPALPMPVTITLPLQSNSSFTASQNDVSSRYETSQTPGLAAQDLAGRAQLFFGGEIGGRGGPLAMRANGSSTRRP